MSTSKTTIVVKVLETAINSLVKEEKEIQNALIQSTDISYLRNNNLEFSAQTTSHLAAKLESCREELSTLGNLQYELSIGRSAIISTKFINGVYSLINVFERGGLPPYKLEEFAGNISAIKSHLNDFSKYN